MVKNMSINKDDVRPYYEELIGYMAQAPSLDKVAYLRNEHAMWNQYHSAIDKLQEITSDDFERFKVTTRNDVDDLVVNNTEYRTKLNGLIMHLHAKYFRDESAPFGGVPSTVINQSQQQTQQTQIVMITEIQSLIDKKLYGESDKLDEKEKNFLEKVKASLPTIKSAVEVIQLIVTLAKNSSLDLNQVAKIFGL